ncbi:MAG: pyrroloquinoline quinone biosynthesis peptide chaperone PqqD [Alphaproteobacteria bacterium]
MSARVEIQPMSVPKLPRHVKLRFDKSRDRWVILAPERVLVPDEIALEIVKRCTGEASVAAIVDDLAASFGAPREEVESDVASLLQDLADKGLMVA